MLPNNIKHGQLTMIPEHFDDFDNQLDRSGISDTDFLVVRQLLYEEAGIALSDGKRNMVIARLKKRLRHLEIVSYHEYLRYLTTQPGMQEELDFFIDALTTNKTDFFREDKHFDALVDTVLRSVQHSKQPEPLLLWSAGCSSGEEPYSLAMFLHDKLSPIGVPFRIYATDICQVALAKARAAVYSEESVRPIPKRLANRYLMEGTGAKAGLFRVVPEIRALVDIQRLNLMDEEFNLPEMMHAIWCRNVMIYFDHQTKIDLVRKFQRHLAPSGFLFVGHSESLSSISDSLEPVSPAIYKNPTVRQCKAA